MSTSAEDKLRLLASKVGSNTVKEYLEELLLESDKNFKHAQYYLLGAIHAHTRDASPSDGQLREYYELLGLTPKETRTASGRANN